MKPCSGLAGNWSLPVIIKCGNQISFITSCLVVLTAYWCYTSFHPNVLHWRSIDKCHPLHYYNIVLVHVLRQF